MAPTAPSQLSLPRSPGVLPAIASTLNPQFVRRFIFDDRFQHLKHLSSSSNCILVQGFEDLKTSTNALRREGNHIFIPTFMRQNIVMGVGVYGGMVSMPNSLESSKLEQVNFRFVFDAITGMLVFICLGDDDLYRITATTALSTKSKSYGVAIFGRKAFRKAVVHHDDLDIAEIASAAVYIEEAVYHHRCTTCSSPSCTCRLQLVKCRHDRDYDSFQRNAPHFAFESSGVGVRRKLGKAVSSVFNISFRRVFDPNVGAGLLQWSVSDFVRRSVQHPREGQLLCEADSSATRVASNDGESGQCEAVSCSVSFAEQSVSVAEQSDEVTPLVHEGLVDDAELDCFDLSNGESAPETPTTEVVSPSSYIASPVVAQNALADVAVFNLPAAQSADEVEEESGGEKKYRVTKDMTAEEKMEVRKLRNRAAAKKSNKKRVEHQRYLRTEIEISKGREVELRKVDHRLRKENMGLRKKLFERVGVR